MCFHQHANHGFEVYRTRAIRKYVPCVKQTLFLGFVFWASHLEPWVNPSWDYALTVVDYGLTGHIMYIQLMTMHIDINIHMYIEHWFDSGYTSCACLAPQLGGPRLVSAGSD
jgi:hypothetical protein